MSRDLADYACPRCSQPVSPAAKNAKRLERHHRIGTRAVRGVLMAEPCPGGGELIGAKTPKAATP